MIKKIKRLFWGIKPKKIAQNKNYKRTAVFIKKRPFVSFFMALLALLGVIIIGNILSNAGNEASQEEEIKKATKIYTIGESPKVSLQGQIDQTGIVEIVAQSPGIVNNIAVHEGQTIKKGQQIAYISTNYQGANAAGIQAQIAGVQYKNIKETYDSQKDLISKQKEVAEKSAGTTEELRKISELTRNDTRDLLGQNEVILNTINNQLTALETTGATEDQLLQLRQLRAQAQAGVNQLRGSVRALDYQVNTDKEPTQLANLQKDITLKQLELQQKALDLNKQVAGLQYSLASVQASLTRPSSPFNGIVEKIHVHIGDSVNPGTTLATISSNEKTTTVEVLAPREVAQNVSNLELSIIHIGSKTIEIVPTFVSSVPTSGQLYAISYSIPNDKTSWVSTNDYVTVDIPVKIDNSQSAVPFIPVDSVYQSQDAAYVYVVDKNKATAREITLGSVYGNYVEVLGGIDRGDQIILNRSIVADDEVEIEK